MTSSTGDSAATSLTARGLESWDSDIFGSPAHPLIGPTGAPGYWDRESIAAAPTSPDAVRNCTFITLTPSHDTAIYYGPTCPPAPRDPLADPELWIGLVGPILVFGLFLAGITIKHRMEAEPHVTWGGWARRAWRAVSKWVRSRVCKLWARVARKVSMERDSTVGRGEHVRTCLGGNVWWSAAPAADASVVTESEGPHEQQDEVQWWRRWRWTAPNGTGSGYVLVGTAQSDLGGPAPATLVPPMDKEQDVEGAPPPYNAEARSPRWS